MKKFSYFLILALLIGISSCSTPADTMAYVPQTIATTQVRGTPAKEEGLPIRVWGEVEYNGCYVTNDVEYAPKDLYYVFVLWADVLDSDTDSFDNYDWEYPLHFGAGQPKQKSSGYKWIVIADDSYAASQGDRLIRKGSSLRKTELQEVVDGLAKDWMATFKRKTGDEKDK